MKILLTISYDGTAYCGWQRQAGQMTVQEKLETACLKIFGQSIPVVGSSRTDTGVHALGQRATIDINTRIPLQKIPFALNTALPDDIVVVGATEVHEAFHPRYSAKMKIYRYMIQNSTFRNPMLRNSVAFEQEPLDVQKMREAASYMVGTHDFKAFCASGSEVKSTVRTIFLTEITQSDDIISIYVVGNGFLYNMVRIIAGTLIGVGKAKIAPGDIKRIILSQDRTQAGKTAVAQGLTLMEIRYNLLGGEE